MNELNFSDNIDFIYIWSCLNIYSKYSATRIKLPEENLPSNIFIYNWFRNNVEQKLYVIYRILHALFLIRTFMKQVYEDSLWKTFSEPEPLIHLWKIKVSQNVQLFIIRNSLI